MLRDLGNPIYAVSVDGGPSFTTSGTLTSASMAENLNVLAFVPPTDLSAFGDPAFCADYGLRAAYYAGAMANGIASAAMVIALGKAGLMGSFGAGGLGPARIEAAIQEIQAALPDGPYAFNLLHNPYEPSLERGTVLLYLKYGIRVVEAAAYVLPSDSLLLYRGCGLSRKPDGSISIGKK